MPQDPLDELILDPERRAVSANVACAPAEEPEERAGRGAHVRHPVDRRSRLGIDATVQALAESAREGFADDDLVLVVATCPSDRVPDASTRVANESAKSVDKTAPQLARKRLMASDDVVAVLDVVVERAIDERDLAKRKRDAGEPVVVKGLPRHVGERQRDVEELAAEERRRSGDGVDQEERSQIGVVVGPIRPVRRRDRLAVGGDDRHVGIGELDALGVERARERLQLVGVPDVVLVGERDESDAGRNQLEAPLEVAVVADTAAVADEAEPLVLGARPLDGLGQAWTGGVVADDADEVAARLFANRPELPGEKVERRLVRGHAHGDRRRHRRRYRSRCVRDLRLSWPR